MRANGIWSFYPIGYQCHWGIGLKLLNWSDPLKNQWIQWNQSGFEISITLFWTSRENCVRPTHRRSILTRVLGPQLQGRSSTGESTSVWIWASTSRMAGTGGTTWTCGFVPHSVDGAAVFVTTFSIIGVISELKEKSIFRDARNWKAFDFIEEIFGSSRFWRFLWPMPTDLVRALVKRPIRYGDRWLEGRLLNGQWICVS